ncbi:flagellar basal body rod protein FlgC [Derxia gummosa]|uniref:Flagellar basal-body rod protein FlgC n=1 Tax=Derxia gummosa DSM 723 TaxID=1121388 RepID=A0A8B6X6D8_9BURK|nr:flagellar basal body rod protein FlgC [Derxia gummosa]
MSMFNIFGISGSGISAQSKRLNVTASNLANAESAADSETGVYRAHHVVFQTVPGQAKGENGVKVKQIVEDTTPARRVHDPANPMADGEGYVTYPNVNAVEEMVNMISASRSYQSNVEVLNTTKSLLQKTLQMGG